MLTVIVAAQNPPVTLEAAKKHLRVDHDDDDAEIRRALKAATGFAQVRTGLVLAPTTYLLTQGCWTYPIELPAAPVRAVEAVAYLDEDGAEQTVAEADWRFTRTKTGGLVDFDWSGGPALADRREPVRVTFTAGFDEPGATGSGDDPELALPAELEILVLVLTGHWYAHREAVAMGQSHQVELTARELIAAHRIFR